MFSTDFVLELPIICVCLAAGLFVFVLAWCGSMLFISCCIGSICCLYYVSYFVDSRGLTSSIRLVALQDRVTTAEQSIWMMFNKTFGPL